MAKAEIADVLSNLVDYREQQVLFTRYIEKKLWPTICSEAGYGRSTVFRYHDAGVEHVAELLARRIAG